MCVLGAAHASDLPAQSATALRICLAPATVEASADANGAVEAVRGTRAPMVSGAQGLASLALIERLYASVRPMAVDWYASAATAMRAAA